MEVKDPDLDAFESATHAQLQAIELGKIEALIPNLQPNTPVPEAMGKSSHKNAPLESQCCTSRLHQGGSSWVSDFLPSGILKVAGLTRKIQSSSKLLQFQR